MRLALIIYKAVISPILTALARGMGLEPQCKFHPTCSEFAAEAIEVHGVGLGTWLALRRFTKCHPLSKGGLDPVPHPSPKIQNIHPFGRQF
jgi:putative membrane protein insertion efficiency factor